MAENRIRRVAIKRSDSSNQIDIRAEAEVAAGGAVQVVTSSGVIIPAGADAVHLKEMEDAQLLELRRRLYAAGFSKRSIATAVKSVVRVESRQD
jgi:hypothetical protein